MSKPPSATPHLAQLLKSRLFLAFVFVVALGGAALVWSGMYYVRDALVTAGAALIVSAVVALTAAGGFNTWEADRIRIRDEKTLAAHEQLTVGLMEQFSSLPLSKLRAQVATSASPAMVTALSEWNQMYDKHVPTGASGSSALSDQGEKDFRSATVQVMIAARQQLGLDDVDNDTLEHALFNIPAEAQARQKT